MGYPRFPDEGCDGYHPGEEQPAMHNNEPQKPVTIPASDELIAETPAANWREAGEPDPFSTRYDCERAKLFGGHMTDDEVANAMYLSPTIGNLTAAKDRIRWLSRALIARTAADGARSIEDEFFYDPRTGRVAGAADGAVWRCFHCDEVFATPEAAREHFGSDELRDPDCCIDIAKVRAMEHQLDRYRAEDSDKDREFYAMRSDHARALIREEEKGYEKGLADGRRESEERVSELENTLSLSEEKVTEYHVRALQAERDRDGAVEPDVAALVAKLKEWAKGCSNEEIMTRWDGWRKYIKDGGGGSWPRDAFESLLDSFAEDASAAAAALSQAANRVAELERERDRLEISRSAWEDSARINRGRAEAAEAKLESAEARIREKERVLRVVGTRLLAARQCGSLNTDWHSTLVEIETALAAQPAGGGQ